MRFKKLLEAVFSTSLFHKSSSDQRTWSGFCTRRISVVEIVWYHFYLSTNVLGYPDVVRIALLMQYVTSKLELMLQVFDCMLGKSIQGRVPVNFNRMLWCTCNRHTSIRMSFWIDWSVLLTKVWWSNHPGFVSLVHILAVASILQKYVQPVIAGGCRVRGVL